MLKTAICLYYIILFRIFVLLKGNDNDTFISHKLSQGFNTCTSLLYKQYRSKQEFDGLVMLEKYNINSNQVHNIYIIYKSLLAQLMRLPILTTRHCEINKYITDKCYLIEVSYKNTLDACEYKQTSGCKRYTICVGSINNLKHNDYESI